MNSGRHHPLILEAWRTATSAASLDECTEQLSKLLRPVVPADAMTLWRLSRDGTSVQTASMSSPPSDETAALARRAVNSQAAARLKEIASTGRALRSSPRDRDPVGQLVAPAEAWGSLLIVVLEAAGERRGIACLVSCSERAFSDEHAHLFEQFRAPLATALLLDVERGNARRSREALEADRQALLQRLDRDEVSGTMIGAESGLRDVMARVEQVAATDAPVLILGETGSGKEVVARTIHRKSARAGAPIVKVNCGAIPQGLIDSALFGHEKGSFTGAIAARKGWFERADGGTLFLDEVAELPLDAQVRLLRILQDGVFERVGAQHSRQVDVRIVAATHRDLRSQVASGKFREDLWYRLSVFPIELPALRDRPEDIPALAAQFASRAGRRLAGAPLFPGPEDIDLLIEYSWPGNVRELATVIERAAILGGGRHLNVAAALGSAPAPAATGAAAMDDATGIASLDTAMKRHIERALRATQGRVEGPTGAARLLRINPHTLRARMRKLGVDWSRYRDAAAAAADQRAEGGETQPATPSGFHSPRRPSMLKDTGAAPPPLRSPSSRAKPTS